MNKGIMLLANVTALAASGAADGDTFTMSNALILIVVCALTAIFGSRTGR